MNNNDDGEFNFDTFQDAEEDQLAAIEHKVDEDHNDHKNDKIAELRLQISEQSKAFESLRGEMREIRQKLKVLGEVSAQAKEA